MCTDSCIGFVRDHLSATEVRGKAVLEVGALDVNGTVRPVIEALQPASYVGVDIAAGPGVDQLCDVADLVERYGENTFDLVVSTELIEHVRDWRAAVTNMKGVLRPGGTLIVTTCSIGFPLHGHPWDYWRYEPEDMERIFADLDDFAVGQDPGTLGIYVKARKPERPSTPLALADIALFSVARGARTTSIGTRDTLALRARFVPTMALQWRNHLRTKLAVRTRLRRLKDRRF